MTKKQKEILILAAQLLKSETATPQAKKDAAASLEKLQDELPSWLTIVLKTIAYLIGLLLAGAATSCAAQSLFNL